ncbi:MAG: VOC family protein [Bacteroidota bacterium]
MSMSSVQPIPEGVSVVAPHLVVKGADRALAFYTEVFGATELMRMPGPDGRLMHAAFEIGGAQVFLADDFPEYGSKSAPDPARGTASVALHVYVEDVDATFAKALDLGARMLMPVEDQFWGDRYGKLIDPFGHVWEVATHVREVTPEQMQEALAAMA